MAIEKHITPFFSYLYGQVLIYSYSLKQSKENLNFFYIYGKLSGCSCCIFWKIHQAGQEMLPITLNGPGTSSIVNDHNPIFSRILGNTEQAIDHSSKFVELLVFSCWLLSFGYFLGKSQISALQPPEQQRSRAHNQQLKANPDERQHLPSEQSTEISMDEGQSAEIEVAAQHCDEHP